MKNSVNIQTVKKIKIMKMIKIMKKIKIMKIIKNLKKIADVKDEEYTNKIKKKNIKTMKNRESIIFFIFQKKTIFH